MKAIRLKRVFHEQELGCNISSKCRALILFGLLLAKSSTVAHLRIEKGASFFFNKFQI